MSQSAWENAPWFIGGGVEHSVELARLLAYSAHGGKEGIIRPDHLAVKQQSTAGAGIRVMPGAAVIINRVAGAANQSYVARLPAEDIVPISPTGGASRTDMIIARIEDPFQPGSGFSPPAQSEIQSGQYVRTVVIPGVSGSPQSLADAGLNYTGIPLALVTLPASTSTVLNSHITDLRRLVLAQEETAINDIIMPSATDTLTSSSFTNWPSQLTKSVKIPSWATAAQVRVFIGQVAFGAAGNNSGNGWNTVAELQIRIGSNDSQSTTVNLGNEGGVDRTMVMAGASKMSIPANLRGTTQDVRVRGKKVSGSTSLYVDDKSITSIEVVWIEAPES